MLDRNQPQHQPGRLGREPMDRLEEWAQTYRQQADQDRYSLHSEYTNYYEYPGHKF